MRGKLPEVILVMLMLVAPALAQTPEDLRRKYGEPQTLSHQSSEILVERYTVAQDIMLTVKFADRRRACELRIEPFYTKLESGRAQVVPADAAEKLTEELVPASERGQLIKTSNVALGCSSVVYQEYEKVMIAVAAGCTQRGGGVHSITIRWKDTACEQINRKPLAPKA